MSDARHPPRGPSAAALTDALQPSAPPSGSAPEADGNPEPGRHGQAQAGTAQGLLTASACGLIACRRCGGVWQGAHEGQRCRRCAALLRQRQPDSIRRTWAFLIAAAVMYLPANLLPVMMTRSLFGTQADTILSGIIFFWVSGSYGLAALIFTASFLVPLFKLMALLLLLVTAQRHSRWQRRERARLYRVLEFIGRWSMLDVFVVTLLTGLVQLQGFAVIQAGVGIAAFAAVVVLTMLASLSFDPRLIWDEAPDRRRAAGASAARREVFA